MTENYKRIAKNTLFLYFRMILIMGVSFYTIRIVLDTLGITDFGLYNLVASFVAIMVFLNGTLTSGTQRFLTFEIGKNNIVKLKQTFSTAILIHISLALFILIVGETIGLWLLYEKMNIPTDRFDAAFWVYQLAIASTMIMVIQVPYNALIIAHEKMHIFAYVSIVEAILKLLVVYLLLVISFDKLIVYGILMLLVSFCIAIFYRVYVMKNYEESHFLFTFDKEIVKSMLHFSGWSIFGAIASVTSNHGLNIILNIFFGPVVVAARVISLQVNNGLGQFVNNFQQAITPQITKLYATNKIEELNNLLYQNAKYAFLLLYILAFPVYMKIEYILNLWLVDVPTHTVIFTKLMIIHGLIYSLLKPFNMGIHAVGKMKMINLTSGVSILMVLPCSYIFFKLGYPSYTAIVVFIFFTIVQFYFQLYYLKKYINISIKSIIIKVFTPVFLIITVTTITINTINNLFEFNDSFYNLITVTLISFIIIFIVSYYIALNKQERLKIKNFILLKIKRIKN